MLTLTSAKRIILLLICLNVVTILTSVTIVSSGMFVAGAAALNCSPIGQGSVLNLSLSNTTFSGHLYNNATKPKSVADITLTFTSNPKTHVLSEADFKDVNPAPAPNGGVFKSGGEPLDLADGGLSEDVQGQTLSSFTVKSQDNVDGNNATIQFSASGTSQKLGGHYEIHEQDADGKPTGYDNFGGQWLVTKQ